MYYIEQEWRDGAEIIPFALAILLEQDAGKFGIFAEAQKHDCAPPTAAAVAGWLKVPMRGDVAQIESSAALQVYLNSLAHKIALKRSSHSAAALGRIFQS